MLIRLWRILPYYKLYLITNEAVFETVEDVHGRGSEHVVPQQDPLAGVFSQHVVNHKRVMFQEKVSFSLASLQSLL